MAFEVFGQLSQRRKEENAEKVHKNATVFIIVFVLAFVCIGGGILAYIHFSNKNEGNPFTGSGKHGRSTSDKIVHDLCGPTDYKVKCEHTMSNVVKTGSLQPKDIVLSAVSAASTEFAKASKRTTAIKLHSPEDKAAYDSCKVLFHDALQELDVCTRKSEQYSSKLVEDLRTWLSAVASYRETCLDGFAEGSEIKAKMGNELNATKGYLSNALTLVTKMPEMASKLPKGGRRSLLVEDCGEDDKSSDVTIPHWVGHEERKLATKSSEKLVPNVTVAKDGSGNFKTISEALEKLPEKSQGRFYIYIKEGTYDEYVTVTKKMANITMYGNEPQKTIVTGNRNFVDKVPTFQTATFAAVGEGFIAMNMSFRNTAGPEKHQAVALRVQSDKSIFLNCRIEAYQDTLYAQTHRQFYRNCVIIGTIDFIFGDAAAIFQNCEIQVRKPMENQQNIVTAQGRTLRYENTGIILQSCKIIPEKGFEQDRKKFKTYLGRPWKDFSRTVVMESTIEDLVNPEGWVKWDTKQNGLDRLKTLYYAEFNNKGPGADIKGRVKWAGYKKALSKKEALGFTATPFLQGSWIKGADVPVQLGLYNN